MTLLRTHLLIFVLLIINLRNYGQASVNQDYLVSITESISGKQGYINQIGDTVIPLGKYSFCFTDTFRTFAIVLKPHFGFVGIDRKENVLYKIFPYDNGPDYSSEGLFRILENNKIGYADSTTGKIIIQPQFDCAYPFEDGIAQVSTDCTTKTEGEHSLWLGNNWFYIDKAGKRVKEKNIPNRKD